MGVLACLCWSERCVLFVLLWFVLMSSRAVVTVVVVVAAAGGRGGWCCDGWWWSRRCGCACVCGPLTACLLWVWVLAWVWAVGRSGGLLRLLMVGCVWRMSSGPVAAVGVAHGLSLPGACWWVVLVAVVVSWVGCRGRPAR